MDPDALLASQRRHLAGLLLAIQRCAYFLQADSFLRVLAVFERWGVVEDADQWQIARTARSLAAHDYETDYAAVAEHFGLLHALIPSLLATARRFVAYCATSLGVQPSQADFTEEFNRITRAP